VRPTGPGSATLKSELIPFMGEIRKWLAGGYGPLPAGVTLLIKPAEFETAVLGSLSDEELARRARTLLGEARRVINQLALLPSEARLVNNLTSFSSTLGDKLKALQRRPLT